MKEGYSPPLSVLQYIATRLSDPQRGPEVRMGTDEAAKRLLTEGELAWVYGPRRHELATVRIDPSVPKGGVVVRDLTGVAPSETIRVVKVDLDRAHRSGNVG